MSVRMGAGLPERLLRSLLLGAGLALVATSSSPAQAADPMALQADGRIVVAGEASPGFGMLARLSPDGRLDPSFGRDGIYIDRHSPGFTDVAVQPDGKILVLDAWRRLKRYESNGDPDLGFGDAGLAARVPRGLVDPPVAIQLLPDGRIAVGGNYHVKMHTHQAVAFVFAADGRSVEEVGSVGEAGGMPLGYGASLSALGLTGDGSLLMAGSHSGGSSPGGDSRSVLARFLPGAGLPYDPSFGAGSGLVTVPERPWLSEIAPVADGFLAAGTLAGHAILARFSDEGSLDAGFGSNGFAAASGDAEVSQGHDLAIQAGGEVVVGGELSSRKALAKASCAVCRSPLLARFLPDGRLDPSFGAGGVARVLRADGRPVRARGEAVASAPDGRLLIAGDASAAWQLRILVAQVGPDGQADPSFGDGGIATIAACRGSVAAQRRTGCLPAARARLRARRTGRGGVALHLHVRPNRSWARIVHVTLTLPRQLEAIENRARRIATTVVEEDGSRHAAGSQAIPRRLATARIGAPRAVSMRVPPGVVRLAEGKQPRGALPFRIRVSFATPFFGSRAGEHEVVLRQALG